MKASRTKTQQNISVKELSVTLNKTLNLREHEELKCLSDGILKTLLTEEFSHTCVANKINDLLSKRTSKILGLELLNTCLPYFTLRIIVSYASGWLRYCLDCHHNDENIHLKTLTNIIKYSQNQDQFNKTFVSEFLNPTLILLMNKSDNLINSEASLKCLIICLQYYSSSCNTHKTKITDYIMTYLSSTSDKLVSLAGTAFFHAQHIGNAGKEGENHRDSVTLSIRKLCSTCHNLFNLIFEDQVEFEYFDFSDIQPFDVRLEPPNEENIRNINKLQYRSQILRNCLEWITCFMKRKTMRIVYPKEILCVIQRGMSVHLCSEQNYTSLDKIYFSEFLIEIQMDCMKLLKALISYLGALLAPYHYTITQILVDTIKRSLTCECYNETIFQKRLHNVFLLWLELRRCKFDNDVSEQLISSLILVAFPHSETSEKVVSSDPKKCLNALNMLHIILDNMELILTPTLGNKLLASLIKTISSIQRGYSHDHYNNEAYKMVLYKTICLMIENEIAPMSPMHLVLQLLQRGSQDRNPNVSNVCYECLNSLEKMCQPMFGTLNIPKERGEVGDEGLDNTLGADNDDVMTDA